MNAVWVIKWFIKWFNMSMFWDPTRKRNLSIEFQQQSITKTKNWIPQPPQASVLKNQVHTELDHACTPPLLTKLKLQLAAQSGAWRISPSGRRLTWAECASGDKPCDLSIRSFQAIYWQRFVASNCLFSNPLTGVLIRIVK